MSQQVDLSKKFLKQLIDEFNDVHVESIGLTGSHARGEATLDSDVDLIRFVKTLPKKPSDRYTLRYHDDQLVSLSTTTIEAKQKEMAQPENAIWAVPGLRQTNVLLDKTGDLKTLCQDARDFRWKPLQKAADEFASDTIMGDAEEVHKVLGGLKKRDESTVAYGTLGLTLGLTKAVAVQRGMLVETENAYFRQVQTLMGKDSKWTYFQRLAFGFEISPTKQRSPVEVRGVAALRLYQETVHQLNHILLDEHLDVVNNALAKIKASGFGLSANV